MPISLRDLKLAIDPKETALLLGAGASIPSGAPSGAALAEHLWRDVAKAEPQSEDLVETASILVRRFTRRPVVESIRDKLSPLRPTGGLVGLPKFSWSSLFTTNFDQLLEKAFKQNGMAVAPIRSNYDFTNKESATEQRLYKIHGCITQDEAFGDKASMILTQDDYETYEKYRQSMFALLQTALLTKNVLVIGQSLRDRHLDDLVRKILAAKLQGSAGQLFVLVYDKDDLRAPLLEDKGARIVFSGIDEFVNSLAEDFVEDRTPIGPQDPILPLRVVGTASDVSSLVLSNPNVVRMFNGGPASYADIRSGSTFERAQQSETVDSIRENKFPVVLITGAAGVGKTTFARQLLAQLHEQGLRAWEHRLDFVFQANSWMGVEASLRERGERGVLLVDECTHYMRATNSLVDYLVEQDNPALSLVVTANSAQWAPRLKTPGFFTKGKSVGLSALHDSEIYSLLNLVEHNSQISDLVDGAFKKQRRETKFNQLRQKCAADMFVCLKNIFANENLDIILLQEYDALDPMLQDYYRFVAALESIGARVHRQLIIRMLRIEPTKIGSILDGLTGIVDEYDIKPKNGIFGWSTRHLVIARRIADFKFSVVDELVKLFETVIDNLNPAEPIEIQSVRAICDTEYGIGRIGDAGIRKKLYQKLIDIAPAERIPWHRLIRELLNEGATDDAEYVIRSAEEAAGADGPIYRFKVRLLVARAKNARGISRGDRVAMLRKAYEQAITNTQRFRLDKHSYRVLCDVAVEMIQAGESPHILDDAIGRMRAAAANILDPDMDYRLREYEKVRAKLSS